MNEQEKFWSGKFGNDYISRNNSKKLQRNNDQFFKKIFKKKLKINSVLELGSNIGNNLVSLEKIYKKSSFTALELNLKACKILKKKKPKYHVVNSTILDFRTDKKFNLVLCKGVLIHVNPKQLKKVYEKIYEFSNKYILFAEYFSPNPEKIIYRKHKNKLFKRDFAFEFMQKFKNLKLVDYGFVYHKDKYPVDNLNLFLLKKSNNS